MTKEGAKQNNLLNNFGYFLNFINLHVLSIRLFVCLRLSVSVFVSVSVYVGTIYMYIWRVQSSLERARKQL